MLKKLIYIFCVIYTTAIYAQKEDCVMINGICWATRNVDKPGVFVDKPENAGMFYSWDTLASNTLVCPSGFRLPTEVEFDSLVTVPNKWIKRKGKKGRLFQQGKNVLFLPAAGRFLSTDEEKDGFYWDYVFNHEVHYIHIRDFGLYWSSSEKRGLKFNELSVHTAILDDSVVGLGISVRCVKK